MLWDALTHQQLRQLVGEVVAVVVQEVVGLRCRRAGSMGGEWGGSGGLLGSVSKQASNSCAPGCGGKALAAHSASRLHQPQKDASGVLLCVHMGKYRERTRATGGAALPPAAHLRGVALAEVCQELIPYILRDEGHAAEGKGGGAQVGSGTPWQAFRLGGGWERAALARLPPDSVPQA